MLQRDVFIDVIYEAALKDKDIVFLSADFGAESLDKFRSNLPDQFIHCGISEQHMIDMAAGLSLARKRVYTYAMGPFYLRCYEQIKCCLSMMKRPVCLIGTGVGLGYADSGPTHYLTEDIACFRALINMEVLTSADTLSAHAFAKLSLDDPKLRYIRLDREYLPTLTRGPQHYVEQHNDKMLRDGYHEFSIGQDVCIISSGYMLHRVLEARDLLGSQGIYVGVVDLFRLPVNELDIFNRYRSFVVVEEQCLPGGLGSAVLEAMADRKIFKHVVRLGLPSRYYFENGGRSHILDAFGLSVNDICNTVRTL